MHSTQSIKINPDFIRLSQSQCQYAVQIDALDIHIAGEINEQSDSLTNAEK